MMLPCSVAGGRKTNANNVKGSVSCRWNLVNCDDEWHSYEADGELEQGASTQYEPSAGGVGNVAERRYTLPGSEAAY